MGPAELPYITSRVFRDSGISAQCALRHGKFSSHGRVGVALGFVNGKHAGLKSHITQQAKHRHGGVLSLHEKSKKRDKAAFLLVGDL